MLFHPFPVFNDGNKMRNTKLELALYLNYNLVHKMIKMEYLVLRGMKVSMHTLYLKYPQVDQQ